VLQAWYGIKVSAELTPTSMAKREEEEGKRGPASLPELGCLARLYTMCVNLSMPQRWYPHHRNMLNGPMGEVW